MILIFICYNFFDYEFWFYDFIDVINNDMNDFIY